MSSKPLTVPLVDWRTARSAAVSLSTDTRMVAGIRCCAYHKVKNDLPSMRRWSGYLSNNPFLSFSKSARSCKRKFARIHEGSEHCGHRWRELCFSFPSFNLFICVRLVPGVDTAPHLMVSTIRATSKSVQRVVCLTRSEQVCVRHLRPTPLCCSKPLLSL